MLLITYTMKMLSANTPCGKVISNTLITFPEYTRYSTFLVYEGFVAESFEGETANSIVSDNELVNELRNHISQLGYKNEKFSCDYWPMGGKCRLRPGAFVLITENKESRKAYGSYVPCSVKLNERYVNSGSLIVASEPLKFSARGPTTIIYA